MFGQVDIFLAQVTEEQQVMKNLADTQNQLEELDKQFDNLVAGYETAHTSGWYSFFNVDNIYFWIVIAGLVLLAIGLVFLLVELRKRPGALKVRIKPAVEPEPKPVVHSRPAEEKPAKPIKVKVVKVK